jgi:hypothetical protein
VLERQEDAAPRALLGLEPEHGLPVEPHVAEVTT